MCVDYDGEDNESIGPNITIILYYLEKNSRIFTFSLLQSVEQWIICQNMILKRQF